MLSKYLLLRGRIAVNVRVSSERPNARHWGVKRELKFAEFRRIRAAHTAARQVSRDQHRSLQLFSFSATEPRSCIGGLQREAMQSVAHHRSLALDGSLAGP